MSEYGMDERRYSVGGEGVIPEQLDWWAVGIMEPLPYFF